MQPSHTTHLDCSYVAWQVFFTKDEKRGEEGGRTDSMVTHLHDRLNVRVDRDVGI